MVILKVHRYFGFIKDPFTTYVFTEDMLQVKRGIFKLSTEQFLYRNIKDITVTQTFMQRLWNQGMLECVCIGKLNLNFRIGSVISPEELRDLVNARIRAYNTNSITGGLYIESIG